MSVNHVGHVLIAVGCIIASLLLLYGYMGYQKLQAANLCKMTYSKPQKTEMKLSDKNIPWPYKLWKLTNADNKRFNKFPVLFIPGHLGSADQARSFASYMHNEDHSLQYFAVDFLGEVMGLHGSDILRKAAFVNVALRTIMSLYQAQGFLTDDIHVTLLGHSYGGYVAKASVVLNNHPIPCVVDSIVMLSSPNTKAALVPDASHDVLFRTINKAWYTPFYEHSKKCDSASSKLQLNNEELSLSNDCHSCVPSIQLLSVVGGENDLNVDPSTADIFVISAHPRNITSHPVKGSSAVPQLVTFELLDMIKTYFRKQLNAVLSVFTTFGSWMSSNNTSSSTANQTITESQEAAEEENTTRTETKPIIDPFSPYAYITSEIWYKHITPYQEPRHITIRASQLSAVGFPVDHFAILWCHQFVSTVNTAIKQLVSRTSSPFSDQFDLHQVLGIKSQGRIENATLEAAKLGIPELTDYIRRNVSNDLFLEGKKEDEKFIFDKLDGNYLQFFLVKFILRSLPTVLALTLVLSLLVLITALLRAIEGGQPLAVYTIYDLPISLDLVPIQLALIKTWEAGVFAAGSSWNLLTCILSVVAVLIYRFKHVATAAMVQDTMGCLLAFFLACIVRVILVLVISFLQLMYRAFCAFLRMIYVRKLFKSISKRIFGHKTVVMIWSVVPETTVAVLMLVVMYLSKRSLSQVSESGLLLSVLIVWLYGSLLLRVVMSLIGVDGKYLNRRTTITQHVVSEMSVIYLFGLAAAAPSMLFALKQMLKPEDSFLYNSKLFDVLSSTRVNYLLILLTLWFSSRYFANRNYEYKAEVWSFLAKSKKAKHTKETVSRGCIHEDGGKMAVFQAVHSSEAQVLHSGSIIVGATYKVVKCFCPSDREFKTSDEWCEWCRCTKCGYGSRMKYAAEVDDVPTLSTDIIMVTALAVAAGFVLIYGQLQFHIVLIAVGSVGASFVARNWYGRGTVVLTIPSM